MNDEPLLRLEGPVEMPSATWNAYMHGLADVLSRMQMDGYLILEIAFSKRYVQFAAQGAIGMRVETTSNQYLEKQGQLSLEQIGMLDSLGWHAPTGTPAQSTPENDPEGSSNFFCDFKSPVAFDLVASLAVRTLVEVLEVPQPTFLEYEAFDADGAHLLFAELGLRAG